MKRKLLFCLLMVLPFGAMLVAQTEYESSVLRVSDNGDTLVIRPYNDASGIINSVFYAIMGDTATDGSRINENRIYKTIRGGVYIYDGPANFDLTVPDIKIVADEGTNEPPYHMKTVNASGGITRAMFAYYGDLYLENQYLSNAATNDALDRGMFDTKGTDQTLEFKNCIFEMTDWTIVMNWAVGLSVKMTDCFVHNIGNEPSLEKGVFIDGQTSMGSLYLENNTFINLGFLVWRRQGCGVGDVYVNHNTFVNMPHNPFQFYTQATQIVTNNLFINTGVVPDYPDFYTNLEDEDALPKGIINVDTVESSWKTNYWESDYPVATEAERKILVERNNTWWNDKFTTMLNSQMPAAESGKSWESQMITMNSRTQAMFDDDAAYPYFVEGAWYNLEPGFNIANPDSIDDALVDFVISNCNPESKGAGRSYPMWRTNVGSNLGAFDWPILADLSYTNATLKTAAHNGLPLGDLNWFPTEKASWEGTNESATLIEARDAGQFVSINNNIAKVSAGLEVYPNPANEQLSVKFDLVQSSEVQFIIYSTTGQKLQVTKANFSAGENEYILNVSQIKAGTYILQLNTNYNYAGLTSRLSIVK